MKRLEDIWVYVKRTVCRWYKCSCGEKRWMADGGTHLYKQSHILREKNAMSRQTNFNINYFFIVIINWQSLFF